jgi:hypothetical protein
VFIMAVDYDGIKAGDESLRVQYMLAYNGDDPVACANDRAIRFGGGGVKLGDAGEGGDNVLPGVTAVTPKNGYVIAEGDEVVKWFWIELCADIDGFGTLPSDAA